MGKCAQEGQLDFEALFKVLPGNYLVVDREFRMVAATDARLQETNRRREGVIGEYLFDLFPDNPDDPGATGVRNLRESLERVLRTKAPDTMPLQKYDIRRPAEDGGGFEERYWSPINAPMLDENGEVAYIIHRVEDVTDFVRVKEERVGLNGESADSRRRVERLEAEVFEHAQKVRRSNERLRAANEAAETLLGSISDGFVSLDREWRFIYVNARGAELAGEPAEELIGKSFWSCFPEPTDGVLHREMGRAMNERITVEFEYFDERNCRWLQKRAYPSSRGISCLAHDVTARKRAETRLAAEHSVTRILSEARSMEEAWPALLPALCGILEAHVAGLWLVDQERGELYCAGLHCCDDSEEARRFIEESRQFRFLGGESLPGQVWAEGKGVWVADFQREGNFRRKQIAVRAGLRSAVAFPIGAGADFVGVIELFFKRLCGDDATLAEVTEALGRQMIQFIQRKAAEWMLAERARLLDLSNDAIVAGDAESRITFWNRGAEELFGWGRAEAMGKDLHALLRTEFEAPFKELRERLLREGRLMGEVVQTARDGRRLNLLCRWAVTRDAQGGVASILTTSTDITERKQAEVVAQRLAAIVEFSGDAIISKDLDGKVTSWNAGAEQLFGYSAAEMVGKPIMVLSRPERAEEEQEILGALRRGERVQDFETVRYRKDGEPVEVLWSVSPIMDRHGRVVGGSTIVRDITERKEAEEALQRSEARLAQAVEVGGLGMFEHHHRVEVLEFSAVTRRLMGFVESEQVTFEGFLERVVKEDREWLREAIGRAHDQTGDGMFAVEYRVGLPNGLIRWVSVRSQTFFEGEGSDRRPVRTIGAVLDVTEQKEAQAGLERLVAERTAQLVEANANLQHFAYTAAHDLRSPLRNISSFAALALEQYGGRLDAMGRSMLERITVSAAQMGQLMSDLLAYSKITEAELLLEKMPLERIVREVLRLLEEEIRGKQAEVSVESPLPEVVAHAATLVMLLSNLVSNGLKFVPAGVKPRLRIWAEVLADSHQEEARERVRLWVEDNGIGIAARDHERVFGVFQRLHARGDYPGTGLGLSIVRKGAERMGGRAGVESEQGNGSRFWLELRAG